MPRTGGERKKRSDSDSGHDERREEAFKRSTFANVDCFLSLLPAASSLTELISRSAHRKWYKNVYSSEVFMLVPVMLWSRCTLKSRLASHHVVNMWCAAQQEKREAYDHVGNMWFAAQQETTGEISLRAAAMRPLSVVENAGFGIVSARPIAMAGDCFSFVIIQI